ncbi:MAG: ATP-binding protein [Candidatus Krumholzibacteriota bacterium]|nr:ATP-binding protein [Candidatus Krumholzibacteriota bacterium]
MLGAGIEEIFTGYSGSVTYLAVFLLMSVTAVAVGFDAGNKSKSWKVLSGLVFIFFSRWIFISPLLGSGSFLPIASFAAGQAGLYILLASFLKPAEGKFRIGWNKNILSAGLVGGVFLAVLSFSLSWIGFSFSNLILLTWAFASLGFWAALLKELKKEDSSNAALWSTVAAMFCMAALVEGLSLAGLIPKGMLGRQFIFLSDIGGLAILAVSSAGSSMVRREKVVENRVYEKFLRLREKTLLNPKDSENYQEIAESVYEESGADFVLLRTQKYKDDHFYLRGCAGEAVPPETGISHPKDKYTEYFDDRFKEGGGYKFNRGILGGDSSVFVPGSITWKKDNIFIYPIVEGTSNAGSFIIGFFDETVNADQIFLSLCSGLAAQLIREETLKENCYRKEAELSKCKDELENANQLKTNFMSIVSHELRTPLTSIKAYAETIIENIVSIKRDTIKDFLSVMTEENNRVIDLVDNILDYSTMESGQLKRKKGKCDINNIIQDVYNNLEDEISSAGINCNLHLPKSHVVMKADREMIYQLIDNLMKNALKFTPDKGEISISLDEEASAVRIVVQDTGKGIPEQQLEKVFERFYQVDNSNTREYGGSGLGLAICKDIVKWHEGRIWVENLKRAGAKFIVLLPVRDDIIIRRRNSSEVFGTTGHQREKFLSLLVEMMAGFLQARKASIMKLDKDENVLRVVAAKGMDPEFVQNTKVKVGERIAGRVFQEGRAIYIRNIEENANYKRSNNSAYYGTNSFISVPLKENGKVTGVLNVSDHVEGRRFSGPEKEVLEVLSGIISAMLSKLEAYEVISTNFADLKEAMRSILNFRESIGSKNLSLYSRLAVQTGKRLNIEESSLAALYLGMNLYDVGMMKIEGYIRGKRESLSAEEWEKLKKHTDIGYLLLSPMALDERVMKMVRNHHESYDGTGYPDGIKSTEADMGTRIITVIDSFRALVTHGPYRRGYSLDEAAEEISANAGKKFDPEIVNAFLEVLDELRGFEEIEDLEDYFYSPEFSRKIDNINEETEKVEEEV